MQKTWLTLPALALAAALAAPGPAAAQQKDIEIALIVPLSGPWARQGQLERMGAEMAINDINNSGGIKSLGGAKVKLVVLDTGDSAEKAKNAAQRLQKAGPAGSSVMETPTRRPPRRVIRPFWSLWYCRHTAASFSGSPAGTRFSGFAASGINPPLTSAGFGSVRSTALPVSRSKSSKGPFKPEIAAVWPSGARAILDNSS